MILNNFRKQIENTINQSGLSIDAIYFVLKDIYNEVVDIYNQELQREVAQAASQKSNNAEVNNSAQEGEENGD